MSLNLTLPRLQALAREGTLSMQIFHHSTLVNADNTPVRARVNGKLKLWKRDTTRFQLPMKYGLRQCFYITSDNIHEWSLS